MTSVRDNLIAAKALIDTPEKYRGMRSAVGSPIQPAADAVDKVASSFVGGEFTDCIKALKSAAGVDTIFTLVGWSADKGYDDIMALFDRAIEASK